MSSQPHEAHEIKVSLSPFSAQIKDSATQAIQLSRLIRDERALLLAIQPGTVGRYRWPIEGQGHIRRIAGSEAVSAYIINQSHAPAAIGIATIIEGQNVVHPEEGLIAGADLDYWLRRSSPLETHRSVAALLCAAVEGPAFATVVVGAEQSQQRSASFGEFMQKVGQPAVLSTTVLGDPYKIAREAVPAQVYQLNQPESQNPHINW